MKILILSTDPVGKEMAGLGIRNYNIARVLSKKFPGGSITLAIPNAPSLKTGLFRQIQYKNNLSKIKLIAGNDLIISQGFGFAGLLFYPFKNKRFLLDLYDPINMEWLETGQFVEKPFYEGRHKFNKDYLNLQLRLADFILCANERQRDMWIGMLSSLGIISTRVYSKDKTLRRFIDLAPFGIRDEPVQKTKNVLKGVVNEIGEKDTVLIWNGGVWNWFDPLTLIKAIAKISKQRDDVKLYFLGTQHPNPKIKEFKVLNEAIALARHLGVLNKSVLFNWGWVGYEESKEYLLESDIGVATYFNNLETRYAHRSRVLDFFWAKLPSICTQGDVLSELIEKEGWGITIPEKDVDAAVAAIEKLVTDKEFYNKCVANLKKAEISLTWGVLLEPLVNFCVKPERIVEKKTFNFSYFLRFFIFIFRSLMLRYFRVY